MHQWLHTQSEGDHSPQFLLIDVSVTSSNNELHLQIIVHAYVCLSSQTEG